MSAFVLVVHSNGAPVMTPSPFVVARANAYGTYTQRSTTSGDGRAWAHAAIQPVTLEDEADLQPDTDDTLLIVADARLDDRPALVTALRTAGQSDAATSLPDAALILRAYRAWGHDCARHLLGDFAFAIYDARDRTVFAARDTFGLRTLFWARVGTHWVVASHLPVLLAHPVVPHDLDDTALADMLLFGAVTALEPQRTALRAVNRVPGGHTLTMTNEGARLRPYDALQPSSDVLRMGSERDYVEAFRVLLSQAVADRLRAPRVVFDMAGWPADAAIAHTIMQGRASGALNANVTAISNVYDRVHPDVEAFHTILIARYTGLTHSVRPLDAYLPHATSGFPRAAEPSLALQPGLQEATAAEDAMHGTLRLSARGANALLLEATLWDALTGLPPLQAARLFVWLWRFTGHRPYLTGLTEALRRPVTPPTTPHPFPEWLSPGLTRDVDARARWHAMFAWRPRTMRHPVRNTTYAALLTPEAHAPLDMAAPPPAPPLPTTDPFLDLRVVRFALSMPPQPLFRRMRLLRLLLGDDVLPPEIVQRRIVPPENLVTSLIQQPEVAWVRAWTPAAPSLARYVNVAAHTPILDPLGDPTPTATRDIRPLLLDAWLAHALPTLILVPDAKEGLA